MTSSLNNHNNHQNHHDALERHMTFWDLWAIGSGLFVLAGLCAHQYAGPATTLSWLLSGACACISALAYCELSGRLPQSGSAYAYVSVATQQYYQNQSNASNPSNPSATGTTTPNQIPALLVAICLSIQYMGASAAVSRSWGDKCWIWYQEITQKTATTTNQEDDDNNRGSQLVDWLTQISSGSTFNPLALVISTACVVLLLQGVRESKRFTALCTALKVAVVLSMIAVGALYVNPVHWTVPDGFAPFGVAGIVRGATGTFFGFLGYDQVCCVAGEVQQPHRNLPRAILGTLLSCTLLYVLATLVLTGMVPYTEISSVAGFPVAFQTLAAKADESALFLPMASQVTAVGELLTLPVVIVMGLIAQPRLFYAMARDGLVPSLFARVENTTHASGGGTLWWGTLVAGIMTIVTATWVPFEHLNDTISFAVLSTLSITDSCLILMWHGGSNSGSSSSGQPQQPTTASFYCKMTVEAWLLLFHAAAFTASMLFSHAHFLDPSNTLGWAARYGLAPTAVLTLLLSPYMIDKRHPRHAVFGGGGGAGGATGTKYAPLATHHDDEDDNDNDEDERVVLQGPDSTTKSEVDTIAQYFQMPFVPYLPCLGIFINWYLIAQLDWRGLLGLVAVLALAVLVYSAVQQYRDRRRRSRYHWLYRNDDVDDDDDSNKQLDKDDSDGDIDNDEELWAPNEGTLLTRIISLPSMHNRAATANHVVNNNLS